MNYEEAVQQLQNGKIGYREFVLAGDKAEDYTTWCKDHGVEPNDDNARFYLEMTEAEMPDDSEYPVI